MCSSCCRGTTCKIFLEAKADKKMPDSLCKKMHREKGNEFPLGISRKNSYPTGVEKKPNSQSSQEEDHVYNCDLPGGQLSHLSDRYVLCVPLGQPRHAVAPLWF
mmetsp:Transcript_489/g.1196  ORF Transcript_489/g.1196 Transcript_489/m.1196 type:complete len:104 (-) Transcript_489:1425-1736(-)